MKWTTKEGERIEINEMTTSHILNSMDMIERLQHLRVEYRVQQAKMDNVHLEGDALIAAQNDLAEQQEKDEVYFKALKDFTKELDSRQEFISVLCVTRDKVFRNLLEVLGKKNKWNVMATGNYSEGSSWGYERNYDVVIIDLKGPRGTIQYLAASQAKSNLIVFADYTEVEKAVDAVKNQGAIELIHKPFDTTLLVLCVQQVSK